MHDVTAEEAEALTAPVTQHMEWNRAWWHFVKEEDPLWYRLKYLDYYTEWIKP